MKKSKETIKKHAKKQNELKVEFKNNLYRDYKNHFVGLSRMTLNQFNKWFFNNWESKK
jgi:hypothetical protein